MTSASQFPRRLTVAMIVRDAEQMISASLESIRNIADEIIVIDTGSTDRTREIAAKMATKLLDFQWNNDFAAARNVALMHITGDWVLWLDAGEILNPATARELRNFVDRQARTNTAYLMTITLPPQTVRAHGEQMSRLRLLPRRNDVHFAGRVREQVQYDDTSGALAVDIAPGIIQRSMREYDMQIRRDRVERNILLANLESKDHGATARTELVLGDALQELGKPQQAIAKFQNAVKLAEKGTTEMLEGFYGWMTAYDALPQMREEQIAVAIAALDIFPLDAQLLCAVGGYLQQQGRYDLAARSYQMAAEHGQVNIETWHLPNISEVATSCWALATERLGNAEKSLAIMEQAAMTDGASQPVVRTLLEMYINRDQRQPALDLLQRVQVNPVQRDQLRHVIRGACQAAKQDWSGAIPYLLNAFESGCRDGLCLRWLAITHKALGQIKESQAILKQWQQLEPQSAECQRTIKMCAAQTAPVPAAIPTLSVAPPIETSPQAPRQFRYDSQLQNTAPKFGTMPLTTATLSDLNMQ